MEPKEDVRSFNYLGQVYSILWKSKVSLTAGYVVFFLIKKKNWILSTNRLNLNSNQSEFKQFVDKTTPAENLW